MNETITKLITDRRIQTAATVGGSFALGFVAGWYISKSRRQIEEVYVYILPEDDRAQDGPATPIVGETISVAPTVVADNNSAILVETKQSDAVHRNLFDYSKLKPVERTAEEINPAEMTAFVIEKEDF